MGSALDRQSSSPGFEPCLEHSSSILQNLDSWPLSQSSVSLPPRPLSSGPWCQGTGGYGALGACASPQELMPPTHFDLSYSNNPTRPNLDLLLDVLMVTNPVSAVGNAPDHQLGSSGLNPCLGPHSSILTNLGSWPPSQLFLSLPPIPLGLSPLGQDTEGYASIYIPPPPPSATQQQLCNLQHPVPPPKRRRLNPLGDQEGTVPGVLGSENVQMCDHSPRSQCPMWDPALRARKEEHDRTGVG